MTQSERKRDEIMKVVLYYLRSFVGVPIFVFALFFGNKILAYKALGWAIYPTARAMGEAAKTYRIIK